MYIFSHIFSISSFFFCHFSNNRKPMAWDFNLNHVYFNHPEIFFFVKFLSSDYLPCVNVQKLFSALKNLDQTQMKIIFFWFMNLQREFEHLSLSKLLVTAVDFLQILYNRKQRFKTLVYTLSTKNSTNSKKLDLSYG